MTPTPQEIAAERTCQACVKSIPKGKYCSRECARKGATAAFVAARQSDESILARFWPRVAIGGDNDCWLWTGATTKNGRGVMSVRGRQVTSPRVAFFAANGEWLSDGEYACHSCDNPACCNPRHIWKGSPKDNHADMMAKGRHPFQGKFCKFGHPLDRVIKSGRTKGRAWCLTCLRASKERAKGRTNRTILETPDAQ